MNRTLIKKTKGLFRLFRFELPFTAGVCVILGEFLALGKMPSILDIVLGFFSIFFISASALIINDYFDIESDKINSPNRPLPAGLVTPKDVVWLFIVITLFGFITSFLINLTAFLVVVLVWIIGFLYNWQFKKTGLVGNLMVCISVSTTFIIGGITVGYPFDKLVWFFAGLVLLIDLGEEIAADAADLDGDKKVGSKSLAVKFGRKTALKISTFIFLLVIIYSILPFILGWLKLIYLFPIIIMDASILYSSIKLLDAATINRIKYIRLIYLSGLLAILIFIIIRLIY